MNDKYDVEALEKLSNKEILELVNQITKRNSKRKIITYSKNFTLSLSNYCQNECSYCFYNYKIPKLNSNENVVLIDNDHITSIVQKAISYNCKEALIMSGERPDYYPQVKKELEKRGCDGYINFVKDVCNYLLDLNILPHVNIGILEYDELKRLKGFTASMGLMLESTSEKLFKKGGVHEKSPGKLPERRIRHIEEVGKLKIPFTTGVLLGIGESYSDRIRDLILIKKLHKKYGHIQEVIIQNFISKPNIAYHPKKEISINEMLKVVGIAKLLFKDDISIQVPPNLIHGYEADFLRFGVNDFGGISPFTLDHINPEHKWPRIEDLGRICAENGFDFQERLPIYPKFIDDPEFCPKTIKKRIEEINI
ncbi:MAG: 7,8-didemethyl-8-hydroxy-5-deazariboflavin synthase subunit CofG [Candidatus Lokiarchaeota archaeon]|nr:7,8-didemethyl-8-hydroxy-5-deazariboflavin synthase subunit CofG [Candidatus Lokiarchaeota archaeon]MBD3198733.1 7,8-didemethyl-8-hydroxy-5-deazariboflavin synthase subunit CofG [Candidatus Lokiarchaeota archaeon]